MTYLQVPGFFLAECPRPKATSTIWGFVSCLAKTFPEPETPWPWAGDWVCFHTQRRGDAAEWLLLETHPTLAGAWVEIMLGTWIVAKEVWERIISFVLSPPSCFLSGVCPISSHTNALSTAAITQTHLSHVGGSYFHFHNLLCLLGLFSSFKSTYDWARPQFKLENTSRLFQDLLCVYHDLYDLGMGWLLCASSSSDFWDVTLSFYLWRGACSSNFC